MPKGMFVWAAVTATALAGPAPADGSVAEIRKPSSAAASSRATQIRRSAEKTSGGRWYGAAASYQQAIKNAYGNALTSRVPRTAPSTKALVSPERTTDQTGDYLDEMIASGADRWAPNRLPLTVFIGGGTASSTTIFATAMNEWSAASGGKISWSQTGDPDGADITVSWQPTVVSSEPESGETRSRYSPGANGMRYITHSDITIVTTNNGTMVSDSELKKICLHEIGHALGLRHCSTSGDIMFWQSNGDQVSALGPRDASTISQLYSNQN